MVTSCAHCGLPVPRKAQFCCYGCSFAYQIIREKGSAGEVSWAMVKLGVSAFFAMNVMGFSLALHASSVYPEYWIGLPEIGRQFDALLRYLLLFLSLPVVFLLGVPLAENVIRDARTGRWTVDGLIAIGVLAALAYSAVSTYTGRGALYYDIATMVLAFLSLGRYLEAYFRHSTTEALARLYDAKEQSVCRVRDGVEEVVPAEKIEPGDILWLRAGEKIWVDAHVNEGQGLLDLSHLTGESMPVSVGVGDRILSGGILTEGFLKLKAEACSERSWIHQLKLMVERARESKPGIQKLADRIGLLFSAFSFCLFFVAFYWGFNAGGFEKGLLRALSVVLIACPCAIGVAVPLAYWKTFLVVTQKRILFKDLSRLEMLASVRGIFFDKTGTLTEAWPKVSRIFHSNGWSICDVLSLAASLARTSRHPVGVGIGREAIARGVVLREPSLAQTATGRGVSAVIAQQSRYYLGSYFFMSETIAQKPEWALDKTATYLFSDSEVIACFVTEECMRPSAGPACEKLKKKGLFVGILTGDSGERPREVAKKLGIACEASLTPLEKCERIAEWEKRHGASVLVGEGLNDSPAISRASVSIAVGSALDEAKKEADFVLPDDNLNHVPWLYKIARQTQSRIRANLFWACIYNLLAIPAAVMGWINPLIAGAAMILSSMFVIFNSLRVEKSMTEKSEAFV